ncbi:hypothetical protein AB205_0117720 [Aquarana catesbeiana]|uniref:Uncharacterized protein n=1 Tax=Aquarana catesbeiana TaxID=8400 RepID=A0A2G9RR36_AQUCT|nr:hypothetical protein AB205_0117720 [Aquarana catesbeiana]
MGAAEPLLCIHSDTELWFSPAPLSLISNWLTGFDNSGSQWCRAAVLANQEEEFQAAESLQHHWIKMSLGMYGGGLCTQKVFLSSCIQCMKIRISF